MQAALGFPTPRETENKCEEPPKSRRPAPQSFRASLSVLQKVRDPAFLAIALCRRLCCLYFGQETAREEQNLSWLSEL